MRFSKKYLAITSSILGVFIALIVFSTPELRRTAIDLERSGYAGVFVTGILYGVNLTAATATAIFFDLPDSLNPWLAALVGGVGALAYDLTVFSLFRRNSHAQWIEQLKHALPGHQRKIPSWVLAMIGTVIIASPLPDELGVGFLGNSTIKPWRFMIISFLANASGILFLQTIHHA